MKRAKEEGCVPQTLPPLLWLGPELLFLPTLQKTHSLCPSYDRKQPKMLETYEA